MKQQIIDYLDTERDDYKSKPYAVVYTSNGFDEFIVSVFDRLSQAISHIENDSDGDGWIFEGLYFNLDRIEVTIEHRIKVFIEG